MTISKERIELTLNRFSVLFPIPDRNFSELVEIWHSLFKDASEPAFNRVGFELAKSLHQFPVPADYVERMTLPLVEVHSSSCAGEQA